MQVVLRDLVRDDDFLLKLEDEMWLMDNHKWALYAWEVSRHRLGIDKFTLIHADHHWDGVDDAVEQPELAAKLLAADPSQLHAMTKLEEGIRYDSFIAPAVRRRMFDELHFYCKQGDGGDIGIDDRVLKMAGTRQFFYEDAKALAKHTFESPMIFDLCLDLFNRSDQFQTGDLWSDEEILQFMNTVNGIVQRAAVVTVSLSFDWSGDTDDTRHLAEMVIPKLLERRSITRS
jgi:hypothetical protein